MVKIISDSTCDLSPELIREFDIDIIPLHIVLGDKEYEDGIGITPDEIYEWSDLNKTTPKTSAPSIDRAMEVLDKYLKQDMDVICFAISGKMSTSANVMRLAAQELEASDRVHVIDSASLSTGIGLLILEAAGLAAKDYEADVIVKHVEKLIPKVRASFVVDTLEYLYRGGRCSGLSALIGGTLKLHPQITVNDGEMGATRKFRGKMKKVVMDYAKEMTPALNDALKGNVFITHSGCDEDIVNGVKVYLEDLGLFDHVYITRAGGVVSSHCGYGTLGVLYIAGE